jgi:4-amino-4-deoxy-L-arabinose transferase-like glycosyltransferase
MSQLFQSRPGHYLLLIAAWAVLALPMLGSASLWDIDEGHNAEAAREMLEADNWITPTFNYQLRVDKPALLYWLQIMAYRWVGVNELGARLPSALAALAAVLLTYELGRRLFAAAAALLAGIVLASAVLFCAAARFANPDALLNACTVLHMLAFWRGYQRPHVGWYVLAGAAAGLGFLAKGPVGLALPFGVVVLFLLVERRLCWLWDVRLLAAALTCAAVTVPWYALVGSETKGEFLAGFFLKHNVQRYLGAMENHGGPVYYYLLPLLGGFFPWSVFFLPLAWHCFRRRPASAADGSTAPGTQGQSAAEDGTPPRRAYLFLSCWIAVYLVFFSLSGTKLPNYILPVYPAVALAVGQFLDGWRRGQLSAPAWTVGLALGILAVAGVGLGAICLASGLELLAVGGKPLPDLSAWVWLGLAPLVGALAAAWCGLRQRRTASVASVAIAAVLFVAGLALAGSSLLEDYKAPRVLVERAQACQSDRDIRVACYDWYQPSLVFYCRRKVSRLATAEEAVDFLRYPVPVYLFVPATVGEELVQHSRRARLLARQRDFYRKCDVVVLTNR